MNYLARKIKRARWEPVADLGPSAIGADALTRCLQTQGNALSVWECDDTDSDVREVVLALATPMEHLDTLDIVLLHKDALGAGGIKFQQTPGITPAADLVDRHYDLVNLDIDAVHSLAVHVAGSVRGSERVYRFTRARVRDIVVSAVQAQRVALSDVAVSMQEEIAARIGHNG